VQVSHSFAVASAVFDDEHLVSYAGLVPVMTLAEQTGLSRLLGEKVHIAEPRIKSGAANPSPKLVTVVAGMCVGADCIDDIDAVRSGGLTTQFDGVYAPSRVERCCGSSPSVTPDNSNRCSASTWWRRASGSICCPEPVRTCSANRLAAAPGLRACQQGVSYGHTKIAGKQILRKRTVRAGHHVQHSGFGSSDCRAAAGGRAGQLGQGVGRSGHPVPVLRQPRHQRSTHRCRDR
jgi:hypothetical protein